MREMTISELIARVDPGPHPEPDAYVFSRNRRFIDGNGLYTTEYTPANALMISGEYVTIGGEYVLLSE